MPIIKKKSKDNTSKLGLKRIPTTDIKMMNSNSDGHVKHHHYDDHGDDKKEANGVGTIIAMATDFSDDTKLHEATNGILSMLSLDRISGAGSGSQTDEIPNLDDFESVMANENVGLGDKQGDDEAGRAAWGSKLQYLLTIIGYAVGLGNIWRFPYLCQQNGGGAFLIPYFIMLFLEGIPLFYLELGIGQRIRKGSIGVWNEISPLLGGLGIASTMVSFIIGLYYNVIIAWCIYYIVKSLRKKLPWSHCPTVLTYIPDLLFGTGGATTTATSLFPKSTIFSENEAAKKQAGLPVFLVGNKEPPPLPPPSYPDISSFTLSDVTDLINHLGFQSTEHPNGTLSSTTTSQFSPFTIETTSATSTSMPPSLIGMLKTTALFGLLSTSPTTGPSYSTSSNSITPLFNSSVYFFSPSIPGLTYYDNLTGHTTSTYNNNNNNTVTQDQNSRYLDLINASHPILAHAIATNNLSLFYENLVNITTRGSITPQNAPFTFSMYDEDAANHHPQTLQGQTKRSNIKRAAPQLLEDSYTTLDYDEKIDRDDPPGSVIESPYKNLPLVYESSDPNKTIADLKKYPVKAVRKPILECELSSSTQYFWYRNTLDISSGIDVVDSFNWRIMVCLIVAWMVVYLCIMKGIKSSGKAAYFTATFPYAVLIIIFGRAVSLKGAGLGMKHMFYPRTEKLADPQVWLDAATQIFYSLGLAFGSIIAFSSYNPPRNDCRKDAILVSFINCFTSIFASLVIFSVLGFMALNNYESCIKINQETMYEYYKGTLNMSNIVSNYQDLLIKLNKTETNLVLRRCNLQENLNQAAEGTGLAFIVFTQAILEFPAPPFWSIIFFSMLITLGLGTMFGMMESILTSIHDLHLFPWLRKEILAAIICSISFACGLIFCLSSGEYWLKLFDTFAGTLSLVIIAFFEIIAVIYVYGHARFSRDLEIMTGHRPGLYWQITWRFISPVLMFVILLASIIKWILKRPTYNSYNVKKALLIETPYPTWVLGVVALLILIGSFSIPFIAFLRYFRIIKFEPNIQINAKRLRNTESSAKIVSSTSTLNIDESDLGGGGVIGTSKPNLETIMEVP